MWRAGDELENPVTGERSVVRRGSEDTGREYMLADMFARPGARVALPHVHPGVTETFEVLEGRLGVIVGDRRLTAERGEKVIVPTGTVHDWWNDGDSEAHVLVEVRGPGVARGEMAIETMWGLAHDGKTNEKGAPSFLQFAVDRPRVQRRLPARQAAPDRAERRGRHPGPDWARRPRLQADLREVQRRGPPPTDTLAQLRMVFEVRLAVCRMQLRPADCEVTLGPSIAESTGPSLLFVLRETVRLIAKGLIHSSKLPEEPLRFGVLKADSSMELPLLDRIWSMTYLVERVCQCRHLCSSQPHRDLFHIGRDDLHVPHLSSVKNGRPRRGTKAVPPSTLIGSRMTTVPVRPSQNAVRPPVKPRLSPISMTRSTCRANSS